MIAYLSHDEVNAALAARMARKLDAELAVLSVKDVGQIVVSDRLLVDLDHLTPECRTQLFDLAGKGRLSDGLVVHSYHLSRGEMRHLRGAGVRVARRLSTALIRFLALAPAAGAEEKAEESSGTFR